MGENISGKLQNGGAQSQKLSKIWISLPGVAVKSLLILKAICSELVAILLPHPVYATEERINCYLVFYNNT